MKYIEIAKGALINRGYIIQSNKIKYIEILFISFI